MKGEGRTWENIIEVISVMGIEGLGWNAGSGGDEKRLEPAIICRCSQHNVLMNFS